MPDLLPSDVTQIALRLYGGLGTSLSLSLSAMLKAGDWEGIAAVSPRPSDYSCALSYLKDAAAASLLRKCSDLPTSREARRKNAIQKWWQGEAHCYETNGRLAPYLPENEFKFDELDSHQRRIREFLSLVRKRVYSWIGSGPPELLEGRFGPGATETKNRGRTTIPHKMSYNPSVTRNAIWYLPQWAGTQWGAAVAARSGGVRSTQGNRFSTVPKTAITDRAIAAEPDINVFYQLAAGRTLRRNLFRSTGWDLRRAQEIHGQVACESSVTREFATLDLSNASDTVSKHLVKLLLPRLWYECLDDLRSHKTFIEHKWVVLEKFSSMGNGFTFELETILFAALACTVSEMSGLGGELGKDVFVYGDDIIVRDGAVRLLKSVLEFTGFELNESKSFFGDSPFRESCGQDFFGGVAVRPFFLKEIPRGPQDYLAFANGIRAQCERLALAGSPLDLRAWFSVLDQIPAGIRSCRGPKALGDIVIHDDEERWTTRTRNSIRYIRSYRPHRWRIVSFERFDPEIVLACATYGTGNRRGGVIPRDGVLSSKVGWVPFS